MNSASDTFSLAEFLQREKSMIKPIVKSSLKVVTSDKLFVDGSRNEIDQDGLLSEIIFGTTKKNISCSCGKLKRKVNLNKVCPECNVICEPSSVRYHRFGKIVLPLHIINTLKIDEFKRITPKAYRRSFFDSKQYDMISTLKLFLSYDSQKETVKIVDQYDSTCAPIIISSPYTLYIALLATAHCHDSKHANDLLSAFYNELLVLPAECRVVLNVSDTQRSLDIIRSRIVDIYQNIIRTNRLINNNIEDLDDLTQELFESVVNHWEDPNNLDIVDKSTYGRIETSSIRLQDYANQLYEEILKAITGKTGMIRQDLQGKNIDFSGRAIVVNDPSLKTHEIKLPKSMFFKLWTVEYLRFLKGKEEASHQMLYNLSKILQPIAKSEITIDVSEYEHFDEFVEHFFTNSKRKHRLIYINRQPTLWRYGLFGVEVVGLCDDDTIHVSPLVVPSLNMDFDGDTAAVYRVHDTNSVEELYNNAFVLNLVEYDHNPDLVHKITHEAMYGHEVLRKANPNENLKMLELNQIEYDHTIDISTPVQIENKVYSYGVVLLNYFAGFEFGEFKITKDTSPSKSVRYIYMDSKTNDEYHERLLKFWQSINWFLATHPAETLSLPFGDATEITNHMIKNPIIRNLPENPYIGHHIHSAIIDNTYNDLGETTQLRKLTNSKFNQTQFARGLVSIGYIADNQNKISPSPIHGNILSGLTEHEFFNTSFGTRKGIIDKERITPLSGQMERDLVINLSTIEVVEEDCGSRVGMKIQILNQRHNESLINRYYFDPVTKELKLYQPLPENVGKTFTFRSPITCKTPNFRICKKCIGETKFKTPFVGILTGQYVQERLTQLSMTSFHTSGSAVLQTHETLKTFIANHLINVTNDQTARLEFDVPVPSGIVELVTTHEEFRFLGQPSPNILEFGSYLHKIDNEDVGKIIQDVRDILLSQTKNITPVDEAYRVLITSLHQVSEIYSLFVEIILTNMYVNRQNKVLRYAIHDGSDTTIAKKYNYSMLHMLQSPTLSLMYQPNRKTILNYYFNQKSEDANNHLSISERIWYGKI